MNDFSLLLHQEGYFSSFYPPEADKPAGGGQAACLPQAGL